MMRRLIMTAAVALVGATVAQPVDAQLTFGPQAAYMTGLEEIQGGGDLNGTMGLGGRVVVSPPIPMLAIGIVGQGVYYFPEGDGSYATYGLSGKLGFALPVISPYVIGGWQWRRASAGGFTNTESGGTIGAGVQLNLPLAIFLEGTMEFNDEIPTATDIDVNPLVIQAGVMFGG